MLILVLLSRKYFDSLKQYPSKSEAPGLHQISDNLIFNSDRKSWDHGWRVRSKRQALPILQTFYGTDVMTK